MGSSNQKYDYDLIVLGSGPCGEKGAIQAAEAGKRVLVVERAGIPGGANVNWGTLPSKTLRESALYISGLQQRDIHGVSYSTPTGEISVGQFMRHERNVVDSEIERIRRDFVRLNIQTVHGEGSFIDTHTIRVRSKGEEVGQYTTYGTLISTGGRPRQPPHIPWGHPSINDSDLILRIQKIPRSMIIIGGGIVACEYASIFQTLGVSVMMIVRGDRILKFLDKEMGSRAEELMRKTGVHIIYYAEEKEVRVLDDDTVQVTLMDGRVRNADQLLYAAGRDGNIEDLNLDAVGVKVEQQRRNIIVDGVLRTSNPHIAAGGDVAGWPSLASTAMMQGRVAVSHLLDLKYKISMPDVQPFAIYTVPAISFVGKTEEELQGEGIEYLVARAEYSENARAKIVGGMSGLLKILFDPKTMKIHGVHIVGDQAAELLHLGQIVMELGGTIEYFVRAVFNYPTHSGLFKNAARAAIAEWERHRQSQR